MKKSLPYIQFDNVKCCKNTAIISKAFDSINFVEILYGDIRRVENMNRKVLKTISAFLAVSVVLPFAACKKKDPAKQEKRSGQKITADAPWFNSKHVEFDVALDPSRNIESYIQNVLGIDDKWILVNTSGNYTLRETADPNDWTTWETNYDFVTVIDRATGKTVRTIDLRATKNDRDLQMAVNYLDGKIKQTYYNQDFDNISYYEDTYDVDTGERVGTKEINASDVYFDHIYVLGNYTIYTNSFFDGNEGKTTYTLSVITPDGTKSERTLEVNYISYIAMKDDSTALIYASTDHTWEFYELDLKTREITNTDPKEYEWLSSDNSSSPFIAFDGSLYLCTSTGISKPDFQSKTLNEIFNFSNCNVNRYKLKDFYLSDIRGNTITYAEQYGQLDMSAGASEVPRIEIIELTKADKNPNEGKTVLELYSANDRSADVIGDAIVKFNDTNANYFIEVTERYDPVGFMEASSSAGSDEYFMEQLNASSKLSNQLAIDLMNGVGPDILMNAASFTQLYCDNCLADLSPYVGTLDSSKYFTNIFDAAKIDGKLYNIPICYTVNGIQTKSEYAGASGIGFTTSEYENFLRQTLNGNDIIYYGQPYYFALLFNASYEKFISNGKADFSAPEFAMLAEYVKNNVYEKSRNQQLTPDADDVTGESFYEPVARHQYCFGPGYYMTSFYEYRYADAILGIPSADGRGPSVGPYISVAVSSHAQNVDACGEFAKFLMDDEIQEKLAMGGSFVANRNAFHKSAQKAVEYYNSNGFDIYFGGSGIPHDERYAYSEKDIDKLEKIIMSCSKVDTIDAQISIILIEEMPAYFSGQKDLTAVTKIAQDRAQKVLNERK